MQDESMKAHEVPGTPTKEKQDMFDMSFMTVNETPTKAKASNIAAAAAAASSGAPTTYSNVKFHDQTGLLVLTAEKVIFQPYEEGDIEDITENSTESNPYPDRGIKTKGSADSVSSFVHRHSWRWKSIQKHQISPANTSKTLLKLVSKEGDNKAVTFHLPNREELEKIRKDISARLKPYKNGTSPSKSRGANGNYADETTGLLGGPSTATTPQKESGSCYKWVWIGIALIALALIGIKVAMVMTDSSSISELISTLKDDTSTAAAIAPAPTDSSAGAASENVYYDGFEQDLTETEKVHFGGRKMLRG